MQGDSFRLHRDRLKGSYVFCTASSKYFFSCGIRGRFRFFGGDISSTVAGGVKTDGAKVGVAATMVMGKEGAIWVTGSCTEVVLFTRSTKNLCLHLVWPYPFRYRIELSFVRRKPVFVAACTALLYRILQGLYDTPAYQHYSVSVASPELLDL